MRPLISRSRVATIRRRSVPPRPREIRVRATAGIRAYRSAHPDCASNAFTTAALVDVGIRVSSVTTLASDRRINVPSLFQCLADFDLRKPLFPRKIFASVMRLSVFRHKLRRFHVVRFPIEIEYLVFRPQEIFGMAMAFQTPRHAVRLGHIHHRHVIDRTVATETTDAPVHMCRVIVINVIDRAMDPHPVDRIARLPARAHWLQLRIIFLHLGVAIHAGLGVGNVRLRRRLHEAVTIPAIHTQLRHVNVVRKRHRLDRLISDFGIFWCDVIPCGARQSANEHDAADYDLERQPVRPAWKEIRHEY